VHFHVTDFECEGGAAGYIDKLVFGVNHIYQWPTCRELYLTGPYDPEGLLGCLTSVVLCFIGLQAGRTLVSYKEHTSRLFRWIVWGVTIGLIGTLLCGAKQNGGYIPINKNLWSVSFIFVMAGTGYLMLAFCYFLIDHKKWWSGAPFKYIGMELVLPKIFCSSINQTEIKHIVNTVALFLNLISKTLQTIP
jgi:heparan-alpha-glucosaminide N-acetyltransferase